MPPPLLSAALGACAGGENPAGLLMAPVYGNVTVSVSAGTHRRSHGFPQQAPYLSVKTADGATLMWGVGNTLIANSIGSGVRFGIVPAGAVQIQEPVPLVKGTSYRVFVARAYLDAFGDEEAGSAVFTP